MGLIQVRRANVILDVPDYQQNEYLAKGFDVIGADGKVIEKAIPSDVNTLKKAFIELTARVKELTEENDKLKEMLSIPADKVEESSQEFMEEPVLEEPITQEESVEESEESEEFTPINKRGKKKK